MNEHARGGILNFGSPPHFPAFQAPASSSPGIIIVSSSSRMKTMGTCGGIQVFHFFQLHFSMWDSGILVSWTISYSLRTTQRIRFHPLPSTNLFGASIGAGKKTKQTNESNQKIIAGKIAQHLIIYSVPDRGFQSSFLVTSLVPPNFPIFWAIKVTKSPLIFVGGYNMEMGGTDFFQTFHSED